MSKTEKHNSHVLPIGFALFSMFFGAGNIIYPLNLGAHAGQHWIFSVIGFLLFGVGAPFLGLFSVALYNGSYYHFFERIGKVPAFLLIAFLMLVIGPLGAMPRTEVITYQTIKPFLPASMDLSLVLSAIYCGIVFLLTYKETRFMNILGYVLSPIKLISFITLIILGLIFMGSKLPTPDSAVHVFSEAVVAGYSTMDMIAAFFFCTLAYSAIKRQAGEKASDKTIVSLTMKACFVGAVCLGVIYIGFMLISALHATELQGVSPDQMISAISHKVLGEYGAFFVCICITFACLATAMALAEVTGNYLYYQVFQQKISKLICVLTVCVIMFIMTHLGFDGIMAISTPFLVVVYPALVVLCIVNILYKTTGFPYVKLPVLIAGIISYLANFYW